MKQERTKTELQSEQEETNPTVAFRIPASLRVFYERLAEKERRRLSDTLRIVLEDHAKVIEAQGGRLAA